jgi:hypothetical protein
MNKTKITVSEALENSGLELEECISYPCPACCSEGCEVEPDGTCEHGNPSILLSLGMI